jgi:enterochelin esterase-like enzyme
MSSLPVKRVVIKETVTSHILPKGERQLRIFLPPGYNEIISYPVVYTQDGEDMFNFGRIATQAANLIAEGELEPIIIVGVDVDKSVRTREYAPDGDLHDDYVQFFAEEMVPFVEARYPVRREPEDILLAGDSLGGTVSLHIALRYPERFPNVLTLSGAFYPASLDGIRTGEADLSRLSLYMTIGLQETAFETDRGVFDFVALNREAKALLEARGASLTYLERDGEHLWGYWQRDLPEALQWFAG